MLGEIALTLDDAVVCYEESLSLGVSTLGLKALHNVKVAERQQHSVCEKDNVHLASDFEASIAPLDAHLCLVKVQEVFVFVQSVILQKQLFRMKVDKTELSIIDVAGSDLIRVIAIENFGVL